MNLFDREILERLTFVSGVVVQQNTRYLMERRKQELFARFVERLPTRTQKWSAHFLEDLFYLVNGTCWNYIFVSFASWPCCSFVIGNYRWWVALLNTRTKFYFARETFNHLMVVGMHIICIWIVKSRKQCQNLFVPFPFAQSINS